LNAKEKQRRLEKVGGKMKQGHNISSGQRRRPVKQEKAALEGEKYLPSP